MEKPRDILKLKRWCIRRHGEGDSVSEICTSVQIPRRTFYNWWERYREGGLERLLTDKPRTANRIHRTPEEVVGGVIRIRLETGWCPQKIAGHLEKSGISLSHMTIYRTLLHLRPQ